MGRLEQISAELTSLLAEPGIDPVSVPETLAAIRVLRSKLAAVELAHTRALQNSDVWRERPNSTPAAYISTYAGMDLHEARQLARTAKVMATLPQLSHALAEGTVTEKAVEVIVATGAANPSRRRALPHFDEGFTALAQAAGSRELRDVLKAWASQVDPLPEPGDEDAAHARRFLRLTDVAGGVMLDGFFDKVQGMQLKSILGAAVQLARRGPDGGAEDGPYVATDEPAFVGNVRVSDQERADAFIDVIITPAASRLPVSKTNTRPAVLLTVSLERAQQGCGHTPNIPALASDFAALPVEQLLQRYGATLTATHAPGSFEVSNPTIERLLCDCDLTRILHTSSGKPLDVGRTQRLFTPAQNAALIARDRHCIFPGCTRPPAWTESHHITGWQHGGKTDVDDGCLLCPSHHHDVHHQGHQIEMRDGRPVVILNRTRRKALV